MKKLGLLLLSFTLLQWGCEKEKLEPQQPSEKEKDVSLNQIPPNGNLLTYGKNGGGPQTDQECLDLYLNTGPVSDIQLIDLLNYKPVNGAFNDITLELIMLMNAPLSQSVIKENNNIRGKVFERNLIDKLDPNSLPDMKLKNANTLLESLLNLKYGMAHLPYDDITTVTSSVQFQGTLTSNTYFLLVSEFMNKLNQLKTACESHKNGITIPCKEKFIRAIDLDITTSENPKTGNKLFSVQVTTVVGLVYSQVYQNCQFDNTDTWYAGGEQGRCLPNSGGVGTDAAIAIGNVINARGEAGCGADVGCSQGQIFYTNLTTLFVNPQTHSGSFYEGNQNDCMSLSMMTNYLGLAEAVVDGEKPTDNHFLSINMYADIVPSTDPLCPPSNICIGHSAWITYGEKNCGGLPH